MLVIPMDAARLGLSPIGQLIPILAPDPQTHEVVEGLAFLPARLPREVELSNSTWSSVNRATAALARLDGAARLIPDPWLLRRPALRREAQSTSALEGTYAPFAEVMAAEGDEGQRSVEIREILNFEAVAELAFSWPEERSLTLTMLSELQARLVRGTAGELPDAGGLRSRVVVIGSKGGGFASARFVPPPDGDQLRAGVEDLLSWMDKPPDLPTVVQSALCHYQFESLHPFSDGNGRIGRLLIVVQLLRGALIREPLLVVSPWFETRRVEYQDHLLELSHTGDWDRWIAFFAEGVASSAVDSQRKVEGLVALQAKLRETVQNSGRRGAAERLAADLVGMPFVSARDVANQYDISRQAAISAIKALEKLGILQATNLRTRHGAVRYVATGVMDLLV